MGLEMGLWVQRWVHGFRDGFVGLEMGFMGLEMGLWV